MARGELFILSAPSGAGKTTLIRHLMERGIGRQGDVVFSVSHTTRAPRRGEADGRDYHFVTRAAFQAMIAEERFLEWEQVHSGFYGTAWDEVLPRVESGLDVVLDIDVKGAETVMARYPEAVGIFVMPPSYQALRDRLLLRALDGVDEIRRRLAVSLWEIRRYSRYDYVIVNDHAERAAEALSAIILSRRHRGERVRAATDSIVAAFEHAFRQDNPDTP